MNQNPLKHNTLLLTSVNPGEPGLLTFVNSGEPVLEHGELVDLTEFLEHRTQVTVVERARDLTDEQLHRVSVLHRDHRRRRRG